MYQDSERDGIKSRIEQGQDDTVFMPADELRRLLRRLDELDAITQVARAASQSLDTDQLAQDILNRILAIAQTDVGFILSVGPEGRTHLLAGSGLSVELVACLEGLEATAGDGEGPLRAIDSMSALYTLGQTVKDVLTTAGYTSRLIAPITARSGPIGLLVVVNPAREAFAIRSVDAMAEIGKQVGMALENARLYELSEGRADALARRSRQLSAILETTERVVVEEDPHAALRTVASGLVNALDEVDGVILWLWDQDAQLIRPSAFYGPGLVEDILALLPQRGLRPGEGISGQVFATGQVIRQTGASYFRAQLDDLPHEMRPLVERFIAEVVGGMSRIVTPLTVGGRIIGCLDLLGLRSNMQFTDEDVPVMQTFANQVAAAIQKARLLQQISDQLEELQRRQEQLLASARLGTVFELAMGLAQEVNNALMLVLGANQMAQKGELSPRLSLLLDKIKTGGERIKDLLDRFSIFARLGTPASEPGCLNALVEDVLRLLSYRFEKAGVQVVRELDPALPLVRGDMTHLGYAVTNLLLNAAEAMPDGGCLTARTWSEDRQVLLAVTDTGCGIPEENMPRLFEPGFTTKVEAGRLLGLGLGLFMAYNVVASHRGQIDVESQVGVGSAFTIRLPAGEQRSRGAGVQGGQGAEGQG